MILDQGRAKGKVWFQINWQTGAVSEHWLIRRVQAYAEYAHLDALQQRIREMAAEGKLDDEIAATLNTEGFRTAHGYLFTSKLLWMLRHEWKIPTPRQQVKIRCAGKTAASRSRELPLPLAYT